MAARRFYLMKITEGTTEYVGTTIPDVSLIADANIVSFPMPDSQISLSNSSLVEPPAGRGSILETYSGIYVQDLDPMSNMRGGRIKLDDGPQLTAAENTKLKGFYAVQNQLYYFTDSVRLFGTFFSRNPRGYDSWLNYPLYENGFTRYSYSLELVIWHEVTLS